VAGEAADRPAGSEAPLACGKPWKLEVIGGEGKVVVVCAHDVRREGFDDSGEIARALFPVLDPARERVCGCVHRGRPPAFVDLVFTARPEEGRVVAQAESNEELDPDLGPPFVACVGTVVATYAPVPSLVCPGAGKASFVYPVRLELSP
jgi:hypothetical protein